ncbi:exodeoxyribonuclease I [Lysobacter sp. A03]|uniref:exodeoxyribonuclease I n=1 Tax=Lysobacter sp. A03 TaxID=1199154 RepID=UPI0005B726DB|nr:exodeoxyribonuclease I [Lysobacter sp. A03]KIQ95912.1 Exodeoxyribonuclease I [Lysobacter sp. A03]
MAASFLFYDLETFGTDPRRTRISQFAAIRTDVDLNTIDEPISIFVKPADDVLPSPMATLVTGITPQHALREGISERDALALIFDEMARPETCTLGYNSLRFDDEFVRHGLFRNFYDPYEREWRGGNSRWDLLDVLRFAHALRPEGIVWPKREDGATSFRLEHLAEANGVREGDAHEALSDVRALIGMARKLKTAQPRLWDYTLRLRDKRYAASLLDVVAMTPVLNVSQRFPASRLCAAPVIPLARHPFIDSRLIVFDLAQDPESLLTLDAEQISARLYVRAADLPEGVERVALKEIHLNRSPALSAWDHLRPADFERLGIDRELAESRAARLREAGPELAEKLRTVFGAKRDYEPSDVDASIYDGFLDGADKRLFSEIRSSDPQALAERDFGFRDQRLPELLFRYRARNFPEHLSDTERQQWNDYRRRRLLDDAARLGEQTLPEYFTQIDALRTEHHDQPDRLALLDHLQQWGQQLQQSL